MVRDPGVTTVVSLAKVSGFQGFYGLCVVVIEKKHLLCVRRNTRESTKRRLYVTKLRNQLRSGNDPGIKPLLPVFRLSRFYIQYTISLVDSGPTVK